MALLEPSILNGHVWINQNQSINNICLLRWIWKRELPIKIKIKKKNSFISDVGVSGQSQKLIIYWCQAFEVNEESQFCKCRKQQRKRTLRPKRAQ